jgi:hypothetical protein
MGLLNAVDLVVVELHNAGALRRLPLRCGIFPETTSDADTALVYVAGHGIELDRVNYFD